jgi:hypothetical protein
MLFILPVSVKWLIAIPAVAQVLYIPILFCPLVPIIVQQSPSAVSETIHPVLLRLTRIRALKPAKILLNTKLLNTNLSKV